MENGENYTEEYKRLLTFEFCPLALTVPQKCNLAAHALIYRASTSSTTPIVCVKCRDSFAFESYETALAHECGATSSNNWDEQNSPIPSPCTDAGENLAMEAYRLATFKKYPGINSLEQMRSLASCGFYFDKKPDHIKCYSCGFGLTFITFEPINAVKAHNTFSVLCEPRESDQNHTMTNFLNSKEGKHLLDAGYAMNSIKNILKKRLTNNQPLVVEEIAHDLEMMRTKSKDDELLINSLDNLNVNESGERDADDGGLVMDLLNQAQIENENMKESKLCKICLTDDVAMAFIPCGHYMSCEKCAVTLQTCPICRMNIDKSLKIFQ
ncbi:death-associated inhibitor of apoptosis 2-like [Lutzomyia longipalpis]|uniref:Putative e3 ubiquitin-protein ligase xiap n=1 Tax=Lutzomyia longipalpis TaxID=7200 RepID=A0A1B0CUS9_LUTLO|nr:death-associated inhibitor of apoptosis 2-like [Lutzomyia longipalpis]